MMKTLRWVMAAGAFLALSTPVAASDVAAGNWEKHSVRVSYSDLDINSPAGAKILYARLKRATSAACNVDSYKVLGSIERVTESKQCYRSALDRFVDRFDSEALEQLHNS